MVDYKFEVRNGDRTRTELLIDFLIKTKWVWTFLGLLTGILIWTGIIQLPYLQIPATAGQIIVLIVISAVLSYIPAKKTVDRYFDPQLEKVIEIDAASPEQFKAYATLEGNSQELEMESGEPYMFVNDRGEQVHVFQSIDLEEKTATGPWLGEVTDIEMLQSRQKIDANRLRNKKWSRVGIKLFSRFESIEDEVKTRYFQQLVRNGLEFTSYDPDKLLEKVEEEIPELEQEDEEETDLQELIEDIEPGAEVESKIEISTGEEKNEQQN